jgi:hypothetical protein
MALEADILEDFVEGVLLNLPTFLALGGGVLAAAVVGRSCPAVALRVVCGCVWLIVVYLLAIVWHTVFEPEIFPDGTETGHRLPYFIHSILEAIGFAVLISAAFTRRFPNHYRRYLEPHPDDDVVTRRSEA